MHSHDSHIQVHILEVDSNNCIGCAAFLLHAVALSAYHTCFTCWSSQWINDRIPMPYIAMARGPLGWFLPWRVMSHHQHRAEGCVLMNTLASRGGGGHFLFTFKRAPFRFNVLNALVASMRRTASLLESLYIILIAWTAASQPACCPAQTCSAPAASSPMVARITLPRM